MRAYYALCEALCVGGSEGMALSFGDGHARRVQRSERVSWRVGCSDAVVMVRWAATLAECFAACLLRLSVLFFAAPRLLHLCYSSSARPTPLATVELLSSRSLLNALCLPAFSSLFVLSLFSFSFLLLLLFRQGTLLLFDET